MSVKKDATGRRSIQVEVEVPGTPEEVWRAIATGPGVSSWFVPADVEEREGGSVTHHFGAGMDSEATITAWEPPHRFAAESDGLGPGSPPMATEWTVEARSGGTCVVRVVHSLFASTDDWDDQLNSVESGWPAFFRILYLYLKDFRGEACSHFQVMAMAPGTEADAWQRVTASLGLDGVTLGERRSANAGAPRFAGTVEAAREGKHPYLLLWLDQPAPGAAFLNACAAGSQAFLTINFYLYGEQGAPAAARDEPLWNSWMSDHFPPAASHEV